MTDGGVINKNMKLKYTSLIFLLTFLFSIPSISHAKKSEEFITYHSKTIFEDCKETDIYPEHLTVKNIKWPYNQTIVEKILTLFSENEPYQKIEKSGFGTITTMNNRRYGYGILYCEGSEKDNELDINGEEWFWNDIKLETPTHSTTTIDIDIEKMNLAIAEADGIAVAGDNSTINQQNNGGWLKPTITTFIVSIILLIIKEYIRRKKKK